MFKILEPENQKDDKTQLSFSWRLWPGNTLITTDQGFQGGPGVSETQVERLQAVGSLRGMGHFWHPPYMDNSQKRPQVVSLKWTGLGLLKGV